MAASFISISSDVSVENVGSSFPRVILIGSILVEVPIAPEVGAAAIATPAVMIQSHTEIPERHVSPTTSTPEISTAPILPTPFAIAAPSSEFPLAPVVAPPGIHRRRAILLLPKEDIPIGRLYRTHLGGPCRALTARKFVHPSLSRTPWCSEAYLRWRSAPLSTMYLPKTSESSVGDYSSEDAGIDMEVDVGVDVEDEVEDEVKSSERGTMEVGVDVVVRIDIPDAMYMPDVVEHLEHVEEGLQDIYEHVIEIPLQRIEDIETGQREIGVEDEVEDKNMTINRSVTHAANVLEAENQSHNGSDSDNGNGEEGNGENGNGRNGNLN
ncbi:hypothetical protein Tco_0554410 [Tanacetum coccineum]